MIQTVQNYVIWTLALFVLAGQTSCASAPPPLVKVEIREVLIPVREPLPEECFKNHQPGQIFSLEGSLTIGQLSEWSAELAATLEKEWAVNLECAALNDQRGPDSSP